MDTSTLVPPATVTPDDVPADRAAPRTRRGASKGRRTARSGLAAEVRESLMLLGFAAAVTVGLTAAAQAALVLLS